MKPRLQALCAFRLLAAALAVAALHAHAIEPEARVAEALAGPYKGIYDVRRNVDLDRNVRADRPKLELLRGRDGKSGVADATDLLPVAVGDSLRRDAIVRWSLPGPARPTAWFGWAAGSADAYRKGESSGFAEVGFSWSF